MKIEKCKDGNKTFSGTFESSKYKVRKEPKELVFEKFIKKMIKKYKNKIK